MQTRRRLVLIGAAVLLTGSATAAAVQQRGADSGPSSGEGTVTVVAVGDIACAPDDLTTETTCLHGRTAETAVGLDPDAVLLLGDIQYPDGELADFTEEGGYTGTWSELHDRTLPTTGNHEWRTEGAAGYREFFADRTGDELWYSRDVGAWHVVSLTSNCDDVGGCEKGSEQYDWLVQDLEQADGRPTLLMWHNPRFSTGRHGGDRDVEDLWDLAVKDEDVQVVLAAHSHSYERMPLLDEDGEPSDTGLRSFVVGTGGADHRCERTPDQPEPEVYDCSSFGVLELQLRADGYDWEFVPSTGDFTDQGSSGLR